MLQNWYLPTESIWLLYSIVGHHFPDSLVSSLEPFSRNVLLTTSFHFN
nr:MAG TPA: hypothetical protein [Caudoviricetes sp.]